MRISHQRKFIFYSNPKCGSESIRKLLNPYSDVFDVKYYQVTDNNPYYSHISPKEVKSIFEEKKIDYDNYSKFITTRNTYTKMFSLYRMIYKNSWYKPNFSKWLESTASYGNGALTNDKQSRARKYGSYSLENLILDKDSNLLVNKVIKLEQLKEELPSFLKTLDIHIHGFQIPVINTRPSKSLLTDVYTDNAVQIIEKRYKWELDEFNYQKPF